MVTIRNASGQVIYEHPGDTLANAFLANKYLRNAQLAGQDLSGVDLRDANLSEANLDGSNLTGALLDDVDLSKAMLRAATMPKVSCHRTKMTGADLSRANATDSQFREAVLDDVIATNADFSRSVFERTSMKGIRAERALLRECQLTDVDFSCGKLINVGFSDAILVRTNLEQADLTGCLVRGAVIRQAQLYAAQVAGVDLRSTKELSGCLGKQWGLFGAGDVCVWPGGVFDSWAAGPTFDCQTTWPASLRFPQRVFNWKRPAQLGAVLGGLAGLGSLELFPDSAWQPGRVILFALGGVAIAAVVHAWRVMQTNLQITQDPSAYFNTELVYERKSISNRF